jgi:hypothetical protein
MRHFVVGGVDKRNIVRRFGSVDVDLHLLDATDDNVLEKLRLDAAWLSDPDDWSIAQGVASFAHAIGFAGMILPSAALQGARTLVVFEAGRAGVSVGATAVMSCAETEFEWVP